MRLFSDTFDEAHLFMNPPRVQGSILDIIMLDLIVHGVCQVQKQRNYS